MDIQKQLIANDIYYKKYLKYKQKYLELQNQIGGAFVCTECGKEYDTEYALRLHKTIHTDEALKCTYCLKQFAKDKPQNLQRHLATHTRDAPYRCEICLATFPKSGNLASHIYSTCVGTINSRPALPASRAVNPPLVLPAINPLIGLPANRTANPVFALIDQLATNPRPALPASRAVNPPLALPASRAVNPPLALPEQGHEEEIDEAARLLLALKEQRQG
jgi:DNA-directed RNA polymerase subunit RPC12/RpoP